MAIEDGLSLAELIALKKDLETALFTGAKKIKHNDRETEFQSVSQMERALNRLDKKICALQGVSPKSTITPTVTYS